MGYQALLFCPDEKLARVVSQVFTDLDFTVTPVHEPFAAVKQLMAQRYDAIVVDCENEQNASLLFRSARNSSSNQSSLAFAVVEGQMGVAKAYRIGANLVLTKPINVEQAKGTLRIARGLLRKGADVSGAASATATELSVKTAPTPTVASVRPAAADSAALRSASWFEFTATSPAAIAAPGQTLTESARLEDEPAVVPSSAAQNRIMIDSEPAVEARPSDFPSATSSDATNHYTSQNLVNDAATNAAAAASMPAQNTGSAFTSHPGSAAAPAPAKEVTASPVQDDIAIEAKLASPARSVLSLAAAPVIAAPVIKIGAASATSAPFFGGLSQEQSSESGRKILIAALIILALAALGYFSSGSLSRFITPTPGPVSRPQNSAQPAPAPRATSSPAEEPSTSKPESASSSPENMALQTATATPPEKPPAGVGNSLLARIARTFEPETKKPDPSPLVVKPHPDRPPSDEAAPPLPSTLAVASSSDKNLNGLMSSAPSSVAKPALATLRVSQGVSQGLLIKRVQPKYPPAAIAVHTEGSVQIEATVNKEGNVVNPKVLSGDPLLAHAAVEAVRQWRYKPYYLDGNPVEIQTQITVRFKAN